MIEINLNNLTKEMVSESLPFMGSDDYSSCIVGRLMTPDDIKELSVLGKTKTYIDALCHDGIASLPENQLRDAKTLQLYFDLRDHETVWEIANKYIGGNND